MAAGKIRILGEMLFVYVGVRPDDVRLAPYWALAAKHDVPVSVHINRGPGPASGLRGPAFDAEMGNPVLLRPVLERHRGLRIVLAHVGTGSPDLLPFNAEIDALLKDYSTVSFDMSILNSVAPAEAHEAELKRLINAGFSDRIMFGSDTRPAAPILRRLENIAWLTGSQRRAILYDNAARFLRLDAQTIARHHGR